MRKGFGLMQAILVIVLISGILMIAMKYATINVKQTRDIYLKESAELFMNSAVELSLLAISGFDRNSTNSCLNEVNITSSDKRFLADVNITKYYLLAGSADCARCGALCEPINTKESQGMVMMKITVETNSTHPKNRNKKIKLTRRTLQRP